MARLQKIIADLNAQLYNPVGLNILWPKSAAFLFVGDFRSPSPFVADFKYSPCLRLQLEIEYYVRPRLAEFSSRTNRSFRVVICIPLTIFLPSHIP